MICKPDLDSKEHITHFVEAFYTKMLEDELLSPIFLDVARIDISLHLPIICNYWEKLLLGGHSYSNHTMNIHRAINAKRRLEKEDFDRWLALFTSTMDKSWVGEKSERAKQIAKRIAANMQYSLSEKRSINTYISNATGIYRKFGYKF